MRLPRSSAPNGSCAIPSTPTTSRWPLSMSACPAGGPSLAITLGRPGTLSSVSTEKPQSSRTEARKRAHSPSPAESGARVGFLESIFIRARASATASPRGIATFYLLFALPEALGLDFDAALTGCFLAAGFMVGFFAAGFFAAACLTGAACLIGVGTCRAVGAECDGGGASGDLAVGEVGGEVGLCIACDASSSLIIMYATSCVIYTQ